MTPRLRQLLLRLRRDESAAVTVDWVVLTAAMATFGAGVAYGISQAATDPAEGVGAQLGSIQVGE